jgi:Dolichyl-phosphate-mannose-protein mannosyltransferase
MLSAELTAQKATKKPSRTGLACALMAFLLAGFFAVRNLSTWRARMVYPGNESYEGDALAESVRLAQGVPIYAPASDRGFAGATYGPLYYLVASHLVNPDYPSYLPLRILSALAIIGIAVCCSLLAFWVTRSRMAAALSALLFLSYGIVTFHGVSALSDSVALLFSFAGFLVAYRFRNSRVMLLSAPLMCLGFYYKPQYIAGSLAVMIFLLIEKRYVRLLQFLGTLAFFGFGMLGVFQWIAFPGQELWRHFFLYHITVFSWYQFKIGLLVYVLMFGAAVLLALEYLRTHPDRLLICYMACAVVLGLLTIARATAFIQYFFDTIFLVSVLVPALLISKIRKGSSPLDILILLAIALVAGQWYTPPPPGPGAVRQFDAFQSYFRTKFPSHPRAMGLRSGDLVQAGLDTPFSDLLQTRILAQRGVVSDDYLIKQIRADWFSVIVLDFDLNTGADPVWLNYYLTSGTRDAIRSSYVLLDSLQVPEPEKLWPQDRFYIYVPKSSKLQGISSSAPAPNGHPAIPPNR